MKRFPHDLKDGEIFTFPAMRSQFTLIETLKGAVPTGTLLSSATHSCGVMLREGKEYMIFAEMPAAGGDIVAMKGSFNVTTMPPFDLTNPHTVESFLPIQPAKNHD